jgi:hypothetical protein
VSAQYPDAPSPTLASKAPDVSRIGHKRTGHEAQRINVDTPARDINAFAMQFSNATSSVSAVTRP